MLASLLNLLITVVAFVTALLILVSLHELGHFWVARLCGIKVLRFSIGFGKPFWSRKKGDTEWALAPIPLGGYVKMVDTREGEVAEEDLPYAFDQQHPLKKIAVVVAGPLANLILAVLLYAFSFTMGVTELRPIVGMVLPDSIAARANFQAGDTIEAVNGKMVKDWADANTVLLFSMNDQSPVIQVKRAAGDTEQLRINIQSEKEAIDLLPKTNNIGIVPFRINTEVQRVLPDSAAARAGLQRDDVLVAVDQKPITDWFTWADLIRQSPGKELALTFQRAGQEKTVSIRPESRKENGQLVGIVGIEPKMDQAWDKKIRYTYQPTVVQAFDLAVSKTWGFAKLTVEFFGKMLTGKASLEYVSGPLAIADIAGKSIQISFSAYIEFLALVSISLGVLNLLPIPVLDGGHLVYYTIEWIRGKPLSLYVQEMGLRFGLMIMFGLMLLAFFNDFSRYFG